MDPPPSQFFTMEQQRRMNFGAHQFLRNQQQQQSLQQQHHHQQNLVKDGNSYDSSVTENGRSLFQLLRHMPDVDEMDLSIPNAGTANELISGVDQESYMKILDLDPFKVQLSSNRNTCAPNLQYHGSSAGNNNYDHSSFSQQQSASSMSDPYQINMNNDSNASFFKSNNTVEHPSMLSAFQQQVADNVTNTSSQLLQQQQQKQQKHTFSTFPQLNNDFLSNNSNNSIGSNTNNSFNSGMSFYNTAQPGNDNAVSTEHESVGRRPRSNSISGRLRYASELEAKGMIDREQKARLKDLIIAGDEDLQYALDQYEVGNPSILEDMIDSGILNDHGQEIQLLDELDMNFLNVTDEENMKHHGDNDDDMMQGDHSLAGSIIADGNDSMCSMSEPLRAMSEPSQAPTAQRGLFPPPIITTLDNAMSKTATTHHSNLNGNMSPSNSNSKSSGRRQGMQPPPMLPTRQQLEEMTNKRTFAATANSDNGGIEPFEINRDCNTNNDDFSPFGASSPSPSKITKSSNGLAGQSPKSIASHEQRLRSNSLFSNHLSDPRNGFMGGQGVPFHGWVDQSLNNTNNHSDGCDNKGDHGINRSKLDGRSGLLKPQLGISRCTSMPTMFVQLPTNVRGNLVLSSSVTDEDNSSSENNSDEEGGQKNETRKIHISDKSHLHQQTRALDGTVDVDDDEEEDVTLPGRPHIDSNFVTSLDENGLLKVDRPEGWIGAYSPESRKARIERFREKRNQRVWKKTVKYDVRKNFADSRLRVKGRFVKKGDETLMRDLISLT